MKKIILLSIVVLFSLCTAFVFANGSTESAAQTEIPVVTAESKAVQSEPAPEKTVPSAVDILLQEFEKAVAEKKYIEAVNIWEKATSVSDGTSSGIAAMESVISSTLSCLSFEKVSAPADAIKGKAFKAPFKVKLVSSAEDFSVADVSVTVSYPTLLEDGQLGTAEETLQPSADGVVTFTSPVPSFAVDSKIVFKVAFPQVVYDHFQEAPSISLPYRVMTNLRASGGSIAIVDFSKSGKPITTNSESSSAVLTALINRGFISIGNADFTTQVVSGNDAAVQKEAAALFGRNVTYLVYGTVKYDKVETVAEGVRVVLQCSIKVRNVIANKEMISASITSEAIGKSEWAATNTARKNFAAEMADRIKYGM